MTPSLLLPRWLLIPAYLFLATGVSLLVARFWFGLKPDMLNIHVFAVYSVYLNARVMTGIENQMAEETGGLLALAGLFILAFIKQKNETTATNGARLSAFTITAYSTFAFLVFSILFTFGLAFIYMAMINLAFWLVVYVITLNVLLYRLKPRNTENRSKPHNVAEVI